MIVLSNGNIQVNRGDDFTFDLSSFLKENKDFRSFYKEVTFEVGDKVVFYFLRPNENYECATLRKEITVSENNILHIVFSFSHEDTNDYPSGTCFYEIKLIHTDDDSTKSSYRTIVPRRKVVLL